MGKCTRGCSCRATEAELVDGPPGGAPIHIYGDKGMNDADRRAIAGKDCPAGCVVCELVQDIADGPSGYAPALSLEART